MKRSLMTVHLAGIIYFSDDAGDDDDAMHLRDGGR
jgi:hypothetical protein